MIDIEAERVAQRVPDAAWREDTRFCHRLRVARVVPETHDAMSIVLEVPPPLAEPFRYRAGQFLSFKVPLAGRVPVRSDSLSSSPDADAARDLWALVSKDTFPNGAVLDLREG